MFAVSPKYDCPNESHIDHLSILLQTFQKAVSRILLAKNVVRTPTLTPIRSRLKIGFVSLVMRFIAYDSFAVICTNIIEK